MLGLPRPRVHCAPVPKCLTKNVFLPNDPSYQYVQQQPLLLTMAYVQVLQYWAEKFRPQAHPDYCPLVMSVMELMQCVKEHVTFYKWDILQGLQRIALETVNWDPAVPQGHPITQPTTTDVRGMESNSAEAWGAHDTTPLLFEHPPEEETPLVKPIALPTVNDVGHTLPGLADPPLEGDTTILSTKPKVEVLKDLLIGQATSPIEAVTQIVPTTALVVGLTSPIIPSDQTAEERWYVLVVTASVRRLNLEATGVILRDTVTTSARRVAFKNPLMVAVLPGPTRGRKVISNQGATIEELAGKDAEWECP